MDKQLLIGIVLLVIATIYGMFIRQEPSIAPEA